MAVCLGMLPTTGLTLPLISYGGSSLVISMAALGLLVNVSQYAKLTPARRDVVQWNWIQTQFSWEGQTEVPLSGYSQRDKAGGRVNHVQS